MKKITLLLFVAISFYSCDERAVEEEFEKIHWERRIADVSKLDSLESGRSYLSIYSQIYSISQHKKYNLTAMISLRNTSITDTIYLYKANYYGTHGELLKTYITKPVYLGPLETLDIVIKELDVSGGTGSNFLFDWKIPEHCSEPIFEGVMTSTAGQQGLSFLTQGKRID
ncbi:DUF3124 domain-containing protein [Winogradskyella pulchriflava]|uniref:DUF3124 domain-containing protein n=1 Tax=Winogradskyella pulchriflava TaxID=1110688 RepID=A0ABV6QA85_9FLAO